MTAEPFVCPFCPLHCDDLDLAQVNRGDVSCQRLSGVWGQAVDHDRFASPADKEALAIARRWVAEARGILVTGRVVDLETARAVGRFIDATGASCQVASAAGYAETFARDGMITTTLGDAAAPHQRVIVIGDPGGDWPRLVERLGRAGQLYRWDRDDQLAERLARVRGSLRGDSSVVDVDADVAATVAICQRSTAVVFVVAPKSLARQESESRLIWSTLAGLLGDLNRRIRATLLRFDPAMTLRSVLAWSGSGIKSSGSGIKSSGSGLESDGGGVDRGRRIELVIRLQPWPLVAVRDVVEAAGARRTLWIGSCEQSVDRVSVAATGEESLAIAAATAGISRPGVVIRGDGSVTLPLFAAVSGALPTVAEMLSAITPKP